MASLRLWFEPHWKSKIRFYPQSNQSQSRPKFPNLRETRNTRKKQTPFTNQTKLSAILIRNRLIKWTIVCLTKMANNLLLDFQQYSLINIPTPIFHFYSFCFEMMLKTEMFNQNHDAPPREAAIKMNNSNEMKQVIFDFCLLPPRWRAMRVGFDHVAHLQSFLFDSAESKRHYQSQRKRLAWSWARNEKWSYLF